MKKHQSGYPHQKETFYKTMARDQPKSPDYRLKRTVQTEEYSRDRTAKHRGSLSRTFGSYRHPRTEGKILNADQRLENSDISTMIF